jgi:hypothetical protein
MASKQFNSIDGYSVSNASIVIDANRNVSGNIITAVANVTAPQLISNVATGTAPLVISSTTLVSNLNADLLDGYNSASANTAETIALRDSNGNLAANFFIGNGSQLTGITVTGVASISNGNSNVNIPAANGNINFSSAGNANVFVITGTTMLRNNYNIMGMVHQANTAPSDPTDGDMWYNTFNGILFEYLNDGTTAQWVDISSLPFPNVIIGNAAAVQSNTSTATTAYPTFISATTNANYALNMVSGISANLANNSITATTFVGNLSGILANGNSNVSIPAANGNVNISAVGNTTLVITGTGANITGTINVSGNANVGNLGTAQVLATANVTAPTLISNIAAGTAPLTVTSTTRVANLNVANAGYADTAGTATSATNAAAVLNNVQTTGTYYPAFISATANGNYSLNSNTAFSANLANGGLIATTFVGALSGTATSATNAAAVLTQTSTNTTVYLAGTSSAANGNVALEKVTGIYANMGNNAITATTFVGNLLGILANGNSNLSIPAANGNVNISAVGNANILIVTGTGVNVAGTFNTGTGNANVGNLGTGGIITATGNITSSANLISDNILGRTGALTITSAGTNTNINLKPNGTGNIDANAAYITNVKDPTNAQDAATKNYVDTVAQGLHVHASANYATTGTLATATGGTVSYNNGSSGVNANLVTTGTYLLIDGGNIQTVGTRILVKNESNTVWNGVYTYANTTTIVRATDFDTSAEVAGGDFLFVTSGSTQADTGWVQTTDAPVTIGVSPIVFTQFSGAGTYQAGTGLTLTGSTFSVNTAQPTITSVSTSFTGLTFAANGNITMSGTLAQITGANYITAGGNITAPQLISNVATGTAPLVVTSTTQVANLSVASAGSATNAAAVLTNTSTSTTVYLTGTTSSSNGNTALSIVTGINANFASNTLFATIFTGSHANGNSNVNIPAANGNVNISAVGNANILIVTGTGVNVAGTFNTGTGNANLGNLGTAQVLATANITAPQLISNVATGTAPLVVTSTTQVANLSVATAGSATSATNASALLQNTSTATTVYPTFTTSSANGNSSAVINTSISANLSNASITATTFVGSLSGAATSATSATNAAAVQTNTSTSTTTYLTAVTSSSNGNSALNIVTGITANMANNAIAATTFVGALSGTATSATSATNAAALLQNTSTATTVYPTFTTSSANGNSSAVINTSISANLGNASITATTFVGALSGAATSATTAGTVTTAAQPNITSVGTLTSLTVSGSVNLQSTTNATSTTSGALVVAGGIGTNGNSYMGNTTFKSNVAYVAPNGANTITSQMINGGTLAWSGNSGQLFSITDSMTGNIFTVNDVSGIPMISVDAGGNIQFAASGGFVTYGVTTGITAAGSTQGTATTLTRPINVVSTVSSGANGIILPTVPAGARILIVNTSANALNVYPPSGAVVNSGATNAAYSQPSSARLEYISTSTTQWYTLNATYG